MKLLLTLSYFGKDFCGYQAQPGKRTVQGEINRACRELFGFECDVTGCSRTDSGVHANMFCATVARKGEAGLEAQLSADRIPMALCAHLSEDISVIQAEFVEDSFHPRYDVKYKEYIYRIYNSDTRSPFEHGRAWHIPKLDIGKGETHSDANSCIGKRTGLKGKFLFIEQSKPNGKGE